MWTVDGRRETGDRMGWMRCPYERQPYETPWNASPHARNVRRTDVRTVLYVEDTEPMPHAVGNHVYTAHLRCHVRCTTPHVRCQKSGEGARAYTGQTEFIQTGHTVQTTGWGAANRSAALLCADTYTSVTGWQRPGSVPYRKVQNGPHSPPPCPQRTPPTKTCMSAASQTARS